MGRAPCCDKANVKKGPWSPDEDAKLKSYIQQHGIGGNWIALPQKIGLKRCGKSCRLRWLNYLRPDIKHGGFSEEEDNIICSLYISIGSRWSVIAAQLPGRTDNDVKNHWNARLKKKLLGGRANKDQQHHRRRAAGSTMRDAERAEIRRSSAVASDDGRRGGSYCLQVPMNCVNQESPAAAAQHQWQLPIELGGRFSDDGTPNSVQSPLHAPSTSLGDLIPPSTEANSFNCSSFPLGGGGYLMTELEELLCCNSVKLEGLDGLYGVDNVVIGESNWTTSSESLSWEEMSPPVCPPLISDYQTMHLSQRQPLFEEQLHARIQ